MLAIVIPIIILTLAAGIFVFTSMDRYDLSSMGTESYSVINQLQWSQTVSNIASVLTGDDSEEEKYEQIQKTARSLEEFGSVIYIEKTGIYTTLLAILQRR